jgi:phenylpropionate dioxygenase-like ring-hydroxylating dioxygenase large terminal subunit
VAEQGGFVWLFYGDPSMPTEERPPIPNTPELQVWGLGVVEVSGWGFRRLFGACRWVFGIVL